MSVVCTKCRKNVMPLSYHGVAVCPHCGESLNIKVPQITPSNLSGIVDHFKHNMRAESNAISDYIEFAEVLRDAKATAADVDKVIEIRQEEQQHYKELSELKRRYRK